jgi:hypothetical protein
MENTNGHAEPNERELTKDHLRAPADQQTLRALAKAKQNPPAALAALHAAQESTIAQVLGRHLEQLLDGDLNVADLADVLRLNSARVGSVKLIDRLLTQEQRQDAAAGSTPDRRLKL